MKSIEEYSKWEREKLPELETLLKDPRVQLLLSIEYQRGYDARKACEPEVGPQWTPEQSYYSEMNRLYGT